MLERDAHTPEQFLRDAFIVAALMYPLVTHPVEANRALVAMMPGYYDCGNHLVIDDVDAILVPGGGTDETQPSCIKRRK